jgi:hypothetical protein
LRVVMKFATDNQNYLRQFEKNYCLILNAAVNVQKNDVAFEALRTIGVILVARDVRFILDVCIWLQHVFPSVLLASNMVRCCTYHRRLFSRSSC